MTYTSAEIQAALKAATGHTVTLGCSNGALNEVWYHFNVKGSVSTGEFIATEPGMCSLSQFFQSQHILKVPYRWHQIHLCHFRREISPQERRHNLSNNLCNKNIIRRSANRHRRLLWQRVSQRHNWRGYKGMYHQCRDMVHDWYLRDLYSSGFRIRIYSIVK